MGTRWKGKNTASTAKSNPMSQIIAQFQSSLSLSNAQAMLSNQTALFEATPDLADLLNRSCFGREITAHNKTKRWFQFTLEETFFLNQNLHALTIVTDKDCKVDNVELWEYMKSKKAKFPEQYKAYENLRAKNWVVRSGTQYGGDFVAYRHHPALVHSEFVVIVMTEGDDDDGSNERLRVWSDLQCGLRVCGSVAKTLLVLSVNKNGSDLSSPSCLDKFSVEENVVERWVAEQCREEDLSGKGKRSVVAEQREGNCSGQEEDCL
ncbi:tRNA-splicing endonuclease subunit Sen2-2 [Asparagus officinalis]|uniref:tRNA-intron lyase n=1 Tax=Asparagus officinalis TaxID=4686 RepID=A0A5P1FBC8_ASPOF|nr:tRNA-splicing endonuclease subunit Sen2-2-like [Asparagus officinalis]XP_020255159.1 tRNA-splicing endonuclease subunit Sen2-2-like [Asparagus officinalis]ONK74707.1 tRNA-splicing endonuclease subunit Sen2-2 [Asparagus officinalis]